MKPTLTHRSLIAALAVLLAAFGAFAEDRAVHVVIETPRGSRAKLAYDPKLETFTLTKSLLVGLTYPHD